jgi:hypothetical protein
MDPVLGGHGRVEVGKRAGLIVDAEWQGGARRRHCLVCLWGEARRRAARGCVYVVWRSVSSSYHVPAGAPNQWSLARDSWIYRFNVPSPAPASPNRANTSQPRTRQNPPQCCCACCLLSVLIQCPRVACVCASAGLSWCCWWVDFINHGWKKESARLSKCMHRIIDRSIGSSRVDSIRSTTAHTHNKNTPFSPPILPCLDRLTRTESTLPFPSIHSACTPITRCPAHFPTTVAAARAIRITPRCNSTTPARDTNKKPTTHHHAHTTAPTSLTGFLSFDPPPNPQGGAPARRSARKASSSLLSPATQRASDLFGAVS